MGITWDRTLTRYCSDSDGKGSGEVGDGRAGQVLVNCRICGSKAREQATIDGLVIRCPWADCPQHTNTMCILGWSPDEWNRLNEKTR